MSQIDIPFPGEPCAVPDCVMPAGHKGYTLDWHSDGRWAWSATSGKKVPFSSVACMQPGCPVPVIKPGSVYCKPHLVALETTMHAAMARIQTKTSRRKLDA